VLTFQDKNQFFQIFTVPRQYFKKRMCPLERAWNSTSGTCVNEIFTDHLEPQKWFFFYRFYKKSRFQFLFFFVPRKSLLISQNLSVFYKLFSLFQSLKSRLSIYGVLEIAADFMSVFFTSERVLVRFQGTFRKSRFSATTFIPREFYCSASERVKFSVVQNWQNRKTRCSYKGPS
jgi:hypothetical protein